MAAQEENGNGRATIALVSEQVKNLGHLFTAGLLDLQRQLDAVAGLPVKVAAFEAWGRSQIADIAKRVDDLETRNKRMPALILTAVGTSAAVVGALIAYLALNH